MDDYYCIRSLSYLNSRTNWKAFFNSYFIKRCEKIVELADRRWSPFSRNTPMTNSQQSFQLPFWNSALFKNHSEKFTQHSRIIMKLIASTLYSYDNHWFATLVISLSFPPDSENIMLSKFSFSWLNKYLSLRLSAFGWHFINVVFHSVFIYSLLLWLERYPTYVVVCFVLFALSFV